MPKYTREQLEKIAKNIKSFKSNSLKIKSVDNIKETYGLTDIQIKDIVAIINAAPKRIIGFQDAILYLLDTGKLGPNEGKKYSERLGKDINSYSREQRAKAMIIVGTVYNIVINMNKSALDYILERKEKAFEKKEKRLEMLRGMFGRGKRKEEKTENQRLNSRIFREYKEDLKQLKIKYGSLLPEVIRTPRRIKLAEGEVVELPYDLNPLQYGPETVRQEIKALYKDKARKEDEE